MIYAWLILFTVLSTVTAHSYTFDHTVLDIATRAHGVINEACESPSGSDITLNPGGAGAAWETAIESATPGSRFFLNAGTYGSGSTAVLLDIPNGTVNSRITIKPNNCAAVTINARIQPGNYNTLAGMTLSHITNTTNAWGLSGTVWFGPSATTGVIIRNNFITADDHYAVYIASPTHTDVVISGNELRFPVSPNGWNLFYIRGSTCNNCTFTANKLSSLGLQADLMQTYNWAGTWTISRNYFERSVVEGNHIDIKYSTVGATGVVMDVLENYFNGNNLAPTFGCGITHNASDIDSDPVAAGIQCPVSNPSCVGPGDYAYTVNAKGNYFLNCPSVVWDHRISQRSEAELADTSNRTFNFTYNVVDQNSNERIGCESNNCLIEHNTFLNSRIKAGTSTVTPTNLVVRNNIHYNATFENPAKVTSCSFNNFFNSGSLPTCTSTVTGDPLFVNAANNWNLQPTSIARTVGSDGLARGAVNEVAPVATAVTITSPTSNPAYSSHIPVTTVSGTVAGVNISSFTWSCPTCVVTNGDATYTPPSTWTITGLQTNIGDNVITVTAIGSGGAGSDQLSITRFSGTPDTTTGMILRLPLNEGGSATVANDTTGISGNAALTGGFSWGSGLIHPNALVLNGTSGIGTINSLLGSPTEVTLTGHFQITDLKDTNVVISLGNKVTLRVDRNRVTGYYWNGTTWINLHYLTTVGVGWHHLAFTFDTTVLGGLRKLYLDGALVAEGSITNFTWTGQSNITTIGGDATGATTGFLSGKLQELRVYDRVLSLLDIQALQSEGPSLPVVTITTPTSSSTYNTTVNTVSVSGSVVDNVSVTSVTVSCPQCSPPLVNSAATVSGSTWSKSGIILGTAPSTNVLTIIATDNESSTAQVQLTVLYTVTPPTEGAACTRWASQNGTGNGLTVDTPYTIAAFLTAHSQTPGAVLCLKDGTYSGSNNLINIPTTFAGTSTNPITIRTLNDGKVLINGGTSRPVHLAGSWGVLEGINASGGDNVTIRMAGNDWVARRIGAWNNDNGQQDMIIGIEGGNRNTIEDCFAFGKSRKIIAANQTGTGTIIRRCWARWEECPGCQSGNPTNTIETGYDQHGILSENNLANRHHVGNVTSPEGLMDSFSTHNSTTIGGIAYLGPTDNYSGTLFDIYPSGGSHVGTNYTTNFLVKDIVAITSPSNPNFANTPGFGFDGDGPGTGNVATNVYGIGGLPSTCTGTSWTCSGIHSATTISGALTGTGHSSLWTAVPSICKRVINKVLTTQGLWPWPMNERIKQGLIESVRPSVDVQAQIELLLGTIPENCKSGAIVEPPTPVATRLTMISQPTATNICPESGSTVQVGVLDQFGALIGVSGLNVTMNISNNPTEADLVGTVTVPTFNGTAIFNDWCISLPGEGYKITALAPGVTGITSDPFTVTGAPVGDTLIFIGALTDVPLYSTITPPIIVHVVNEDGLVDVTSTATITLSIYEPVGHEELIGTLVKDAVAGIAVFNDVAIAGTIREEYAIKAVSPGLNQGSTSVVVVSRVATDQSAGSLRSTPLFLLNRIR